MKAYTAEDWTAQLEEVLALQSIFAENFRVLHLPGQQSDAPSAAGSSSGGSSSSDGSTQPDPALCGESVEGVEQQLEALLLKGDPPALGSSPLCCEALVSVELPAGQLQLMISTDTLSSKAQQQHAESQQQALLQQCSASDAPPTPPQQQQHQDGSSCLMPFGPPLKHLPPVCLQLQLPPDYPSQEHSPPAVSLHASWLSSAQQQALQEQLLQLWREQGPGPVCFSWLEHVKVAALPALGITEQLVLAEQQVEQPVADEQQQEVVEQELAQQMRQLTHTQQQQQQQQDGTQSRAASSGGSSSRSRSQQLSAGAPAFQPFSTAGPGPNIGSRGGGSSRGNGSSSGRAPQGAACDHHHQQQEQQQRPPPPPPPLPECADTATNTNTSSSSIPVDQLALQLLRYDAAREADDFNSSCWTCTICFEQVPGAACMRLPDCRHFYCTACLSSAAAAQLDSGAVESMRCPEPSCRRVLPPFVVKELLDAEAFARWEEMVLSRALDRMDDVVYCPRCDTVAVADSDGCALCPKCYYAFCAECSDSWHPGTPCLNLEERVRILGRRRRGTTAEDRARDLDLQNQAMNLRYISTASKACPVCGMATIKHEGCNKMKCGNCSSNWCWKCCQAISGYEHFRDNPLCVLFDQAEIDRWHAMLFANERAAQVDALHAGVVRARNAAGAGAATVRLCRCPVCGQENLREGRNNLLRCWSCTSHFCYSCRAWLRGKVGLHFIGPKACKQHGE